MLEKDVAEQVQDYLEKLGYSRHLLSSEMRTNYNERIDLVVYDKGNPYIVVEVKSDQKVFKGKGADSLRFDPFVRQAQSYAASLNAPYYLLTNGTSYFWFETDSSGRPELLKNPVFPPENRYLSEYDVVRIFQDLRDFFFRNGVSSPRDEAAIVIYAKLLYEHGDQRLEEGLINSHGEYNPSLRSDLISIPLRELLQLSYYASGSAHYDRERTYYSRAFELVNRISFREIDAQALLNALDKVFIGEQIPYDGPRVPRWLADFLVRLSQIRTHDAVLDIYSNYGDIAAAVLLHSQQNHAENLVGISPNATSALWAQIQQFILSDGKNRNNILLGDVPPYNRWNGADGLFLEQQYLRLTQIIVAPPFGARFDDREAQRYSSLRGTNPSEDLYLELAINWVNIGGRITAIVPEGLLLAGNRRSIREFLITNTHVTAIISLGTFLPQTKVKSSVLVLDKKHSLEPYDIFMCHIGEVTNADTFDSRSIPQVAEALNSFEQWGEKQAFNDKLTSTIVPSDKLDINNWAVFHYITANALNNEVISQYAAVRLGSLVTKIKRGSQITLDDNGPLPVIGPAMIRPMQLDPEKMNHTVLDKVPRTALTVQSGDIVLHGIGKYGGAAAMVEDGLEGAFISRHVILIRPNPNIVIPEYLAIALNSTFVSSQGGLTKRGTVKEGLAASELNDVIIPVPSMIIQQALVARMRKARDELFLAQDRLEAAKLGFTRSIKDLSEWGLE